MIKILKNVYYCEFCKRRSLSASHTLKHEKHCTANPNRKCRLCEIENISKVIEEFKKRFTLKAHLIDPCDENETYYEKEIIWTGEPVTLKEVLDSVDNCPNCVLAILRQCGFNKHYFQFEEYDYKKEISAALSERNKNEWYHDY